LRKLKPDGPDETTEKRSFRESLQRSLQAATKRKLKNLRQKKKSWENGNTIFLLNNLSGSKENIRIPVVLPHRVENRRLSLASPTIDEMKLDQLVNKKEKVHLLQKFDKKKFKISQQSRNKIRSDFC
jgi:hypothetical protein